MIDLGINLFQEIAALGGGGGGYSISNSLRFNDDDSARLTWTPTVTGDARTATVSAWIKRGSIDTEQWIWHNGLSRKSAIRIRSDNTINFGIAQGGVGKRNTTTAVFRDISGWYHIVFVIDIDNATSTDRLRLYVNGSRITDLSSTAYPSSGTDAENLSNTTIQCIGSDEDELDHYFDGYMAEINFIDGQALTADDFGEINEDTGEWSPKAYEGTYGTNGFYLEFEDGAALGDDTSGNTNDWTPTNLASTDQMLDTPTNNFATLNPNFRGGEIGESLAEGNLYYNSGDGDENYVCASQSVSTGKWYFEILPSSSDTHGAYGFTNADTLIQSTAVSTNPYDINSGGMIRPDGNGSPNYKINSTSTSISVTTNSVFGIALDADTGGIEFFENGVSVGSGTITGITNYIPFASMHSGSAGRIGIANFNFGADSSFAGNKTRQGNTDANGKGDFYYTPPSGYLALCTDNLPEPAIVDSESHFNVVTYTGDGTTPQAITGVGFQPDLVWIKRRDSATDNTVLDSIRGDARLETNNTDAEVGGNVNIFSSFDPDGFTTGLSNQVGASGGTYVAWCWKAGGTAVSNTDGSITSQVSANVDAGFSIVGYTGTGSPESFGHGLSQRPDLVIIKDRDIAVNWNVKHFETMPNDKDYLELESTDPVQTATTSTFVLSSSNDLVIAYGTSGRVSNNGEDHIAYCFHSVDGFSKFGSYVGNGSANGPFVYTGFRPAFVLYKRAIGGTGKWILADNKREGYNGDNPALYPNLSNTESISGTSIDLLSNGFKILNPNTGHNASGSTYIYMAFAESPFKNAVAR